MRGDMQAEPSASTCFQSMFDSSYADRPYRANCRYRSACGSYRCHTDCHRRRRTFIALCTQSNSVAFFQKQNHIVFAFASEVRNHPWIGSVQGAVATWSVISMQNLLRRL